MWPNLQEAMESWIKLGSSPRKIGLQKNPALLELKIYLSTEYAQLGVCFQKSKSYNVIYSMNKTK